MRTHAALWLALAAAACVDGVSPVAGPRMPVAFSFQTVEGMSPAEVGALGDAFDEVDRFHLTIRGSVSGTVFFDDDITVTPGGDIHVLTVELGEDAANRILIVDITAFVGTQELFRATQEIPVQSTGSTVQATVPIRYTGPGIRGSVTDVDGVGIAGVTVTLLQGGSTFAQTETSSDGTFLFRDLSAGSYVVRPTATSGLTSCPSERQVQLGTNDARVAGFLFRSGECVTRLLILSGGDVDDTDATAELFAGLPDIVTSTYFVVSRTPGLSVLRQYDVVLVYENGLFQESQLVGGELTDFIGLGGNVVFGEFFWQSRSDAETTAKGWGPLEALDPFTSDGGVTSYREPSTLGTVTAHELTTGLTTLTSTIGLSEGVTAKTATTVVAEWADGVPLVGFQTGSAGQRLVGVSLFPAHSTVCCVAGDVTTLWRNAVRWAGIAGGPARSGVMASGSR